MENVTCDTIPLCDGRRYCNTFHRGNVELLRCSVFPVDLPAVIQTCGGSGGGKQCIFPFTYDSKVFIECSHYNTTQGKTPFPWCAVDVDQQNVLTQWAYCTCPCKTNLTQE